MSQGGRVSLPAHGATSLVSPDLPPVRARCGVAWGECLGSSWPLGACAPSPPSCALGLSLCVTAPPRGPSPVGGQGFRQAVQVVQVVVCGEELAAGGTDGGCPEGPADHPWRRGGLFLWSLFPVGCPPACPGSTLGTWGASRTVPTFPRTATRRALKAAVCRPYPCSCP